ncbi:hypothetical protein BJX66DRAFT_318218 [Aspergillus keveii]|uniref:Secreted protein n=1 Tax=Aspergillus keveii TaxID=714993 RepID=A0ABR4FK66_9EURO
MLICFTVCCRPGFPLQLWQAETTEQLSFISPMWLNLRRHTRRVTVCKRSLPLINSLHSGSHIDRSPEHLLPRPVTSKESMQPCCWLFGR